MTDDFDPYGALGGDAEPLPWSWSYVRDPTVLVPWLGCAALSAFLADRTPQRARAGAPPTSAAAPRQPLVLHTQKRPEAQARDDEARAA